MGVKLIYSDLLQYAKQDLKTVSVNDIQPFADINVLKKDNIPDINYATLEQDRWVLDGNFEWFPDSYTDKAYISESVSNADKEFNTPIVIIREFDNLHSCSGIQITFDMAAGDYCNHMLTEWFKEGVKIAEKESYTNNAKYYLNYPVELYDKVQITFYSMNKANRYLKIVSIDDGRIMELGRESLSDINLVEEIDLQNAQIPINTLNFSIVTSDKILFQKMQTVNIFYDNDFLGKFYVMSSKRDNSCKYSVECESIIGLLEQSRAKSLYTGVSKTSKPVDKPLNEVVEHIMSDSNIQYEIDDSLSEKTVKGYLQRGTKREALLQVSMVCDFRADDTRSDKIRLLPNDYGDVYNIPQERIIYPISVLSEDYVTEVQTNYYYFRTSSDYDTHWELIKNPLVPFGTPANHVDISDCMLITGDNVYNILDKNIEYYQKNTLWEFSMVWQGEKAGDILNFYDEDGESRSGRIYRLDISLSDKPIAAVSLREV